MKSIKSKIRMIVLALLVVNSVLIGVITSLLNVKGIDRIMETTVAPVSRITAQAVKWRLDNYWAPLAEAASLGIFLDSQPTDPELIAFTEESHPATGSCTSERWTQTELPTAASITEARITF